MKYKQIWKTAASCLVAALMFPSCSDDEGGGGDVQDDRYRTLMITLNSLGNQEVGTRAESEDDVIDPDHPDSFDEHYISRYWLLILKQDASGEFKVDRVIDSNDPEDKVPHPNNSHPNSETELGVEVEIGQTYRFYALANLDGLANGDEVIATLDALETGDSFDPTKILDATDESKIIYASVKEMSKYPKDGQSYIPMTSYGYDETITSSTTRLTDDEGKPESIALIRLIGKVTVEVTNLTGKAIDVESLKLQFFREGPIYLFPYDVNKEIDGTPTRYLLQSDMKDSYFPTFPENVSASNKEITIVSEAKKVQSSTLDKPEPVEVATCYVPETDLTPDDIKLVAKIDGKSDAPQNAHFSFVRRNDWMKIPVQINHVNSTFTVEQEHMPIGGIPDKLKFNALEPNVQIIECETDHAGKVTVSFNEISVGGGVFTNPVLLTDDKAVAGTDIEKTRYKILSNGKDVLLDNVKLNVNSSEKNGSIELTLQELASSATAEVELLLVFVEKEAFDSEDAIGPNTKRMAVPYTIKLTYNPKN